MRKRLDLLFYDVEFLFRVPLVFLFSFLTSLSSISSLKNLHLCNWFILYKLNHTQFNRCNYPLVQRKGMKKTGCKIVEREVPNKSWCCYEPCGAIGTEGKYYNRWSREKMRNNRKTVYVKLSNSLCNAIEKKKFDFLVIEKLEKSVVYAERSHVSL